MNFASILALTLAVAIPATAQEAEDLAENDALALLPIGATLTHFSHPRYNEKNEPVSLLTAGKMVIKSAAVFSGEDLTVRLFKEGRNVSNRVTIEEADFWVKKERLEATGRIFLHSTEDDLAARGNGGVIDLQEQRGILLGPAHTRFLLPQPSTTMKTTSSLLLAGSLLASGEPSAQFSSTELADFERAVLPPQRPIDDTSQQFAAAQQREAGLTLRLTNFLIAIGRSALLNQLEAPEPPKEDDIPLEDLFKPGPDALVIQSDQGFYFDGKNQEFAYLGKVNLRGKGMAMSCTNGLKAILDPPPEKKKDKESKNPVKKFGEIRQVSASGQVILRGRDEEGNLIDIRADRALYDAKNETVILRGKDMFFRRGDTAARSSDPKSTVKIKLLPNESFDANLQGNWITRFSADLLKDEKEKKK